MKNLVFGLILVLFNMVYGQDFLSVNYPVIGLKDSSSSLPMMKSAMFNNKREVYFMGERYCYLDEHMSRSFSGKSYCWVGDKDVFDKIISKRAKMFMDSISIKHRINMSLIKCQKIGLEDSETTILRENLGKHRYYYYTFERTRDCYEEHDFKNFVGRFKANSFNVKVLVEYFRSFNGMYEYLRYYIID